MPGTEPGTLLLTNAADRRQIVVWPRRLILAGYTGRDREQVQRHIDELLEQGIPAPERVPELYPGIAHAVQIGGALPAGAGWSSGEVEYVLFVTARGTFVGVGSDHTDRELERTSVVAAKQAFPKIVGPTVWPLEQLAGDWDVLMIRSWISQDGDRFLYQQASLSGIIAPHDLLALIAEADRGDGLVVFSGTVAATHPAPQTGRCHFEGEIVRPDGQVLLSCSYEYEAAPGGR